MPARFFFVSRTSSSLRLNLWSPGSTPSYKKHNVESGGVGGGWGGLRINSRGRLSHLEHPNLGIGVWSTARRKEGPDRTSGDKKNHEPAHKKKKIMLLV